ncbi:hypothetical protein ASG19_10355 [Rhizobium sp. Leaf306]|nr:hypothetical protein ASG19_10355 [Rhizobium sp. Leaf306]
MRWQIIGRFRPRLDALQHSFPLPICHETDINSVSQRKEADMGRTYPLNVLVVGIAFVFVASMLFI